VALCLAAPGILSGSVLAFARSMGEFGATIMIAGNIPGQTRTIPLFVYSELDAPGGIAAAWPLILISIAIAALALMAGEFLERRGRRILGTG
jgi:molybdate transport system permease protein